MSVTEYVQKYSYNLAQSGEPLGDMYMYLLVEPRLSF